MSDREYVTCQRCKHRYAGKVPKGGDGSVLYPRKHSRRIPITNSLGITIIPGKKVVCNGSFMVAEEYYQGGE